MRIHFLFFKFLKKIDYWKLFCSIIICQLAGIIGSIFTTKSVSSWYPTLNKPFFNPPNWLFAPVWTILFLMMGIALYLVWQKKADKNIIIIFSIQLGLNILWSIMFFGLQNPLAGLIEIVVLWGAILTTTIIFYRINKTAGYLLIPYLAWVSFATVLNLFLYILN